ncbi:hypothetical protein AGMMS49525_17030 [Bacteroidia bacterium]|nr:hypothetical protein AGMMS49525_17030 [Bacteroidia bacterium]
MQCTRSYINNQNYTGTHSISGCWVEIANTTIQNTATVNVHANKGVALKTGFWAKAGSNVSITAGGSSTLLSTESSILEEQLTQEVSDQKFNFDVYPNPNDGNFTVSLKVADMQPYSVEIFNSSGLLVIRAHCDAKQLTFNRSDLPRGIYYVKVTIGANTATKKVIVK